MPEVVVPWETLVDDVSGRDTARDWEGFGVVEWVTWDWDDVKVWVEELLDEVLDDWDEIWESWCCVSWLCWGGWRDDDETKVDPKFAAEFETALELSTRLAGTILLEKINAIDIMKNI